MAFDLGTHMQRGTVADDKENSQAQVLRQNPLSRSHTSQAPAFIYVSYSTTIGIKRAL